MKIERRGNYATKPELEEREGAPPKISGYASVFYNGTPESEYRFDDVVERIMPTAFDFALTSSDVRALFNHDANIVLGRQKAGTLLLTKDQRGLSYSIMPPDSPNGQNVREALRRGDVSGSSFGFTVGRKGQTWTRGADGVYLREIHSVEELFDVGPVTFPAYTGSDSSLRSIGEPEDFSKFKAELSGDALQASHVRTAELRRLELLDLK